MIAQRTVRDKHLLLSIAQHAVQRLSNCLLGVHECTENCACTL